MKHIFKIVAAADTLCRTNNCIHIYSRFYVGPV